MFSQDRTQELLEFAGYQDWPYSCPFAFEDLGFHDSRIVTVHRQHAVVRVFLSSATIGKGHPLNTSNIYLIARPIVLEFGDVSDEWLRLASDPQDSLEPLARDIEEIMETSHDAGNYVFEGYDETREWVKWQITAQVLNAYWRMMVLPWEA